MKKYKTILCLLVLANSAIVGYAACTVVNRVIGKDSGIMLPIAFTYDLTVKAGTAKNVVTSTIIPALEKAFAVKSSQRLIVACAPKGTDTSKFSNIVGMDLNPKDSIVRPCPGKQNCFTVHSQSTLFTKSSNKGAAQTFLLAIQGLLPSKADVPNVAIVSLGNLKNTVPKASGLRTSPPAAAPEPTTLQEKIDLLRRENQPAFIGMIVGIAVGSILIIAGASYGIYYCYMNRKK